MQYRRQLFRIHKQARQIAAPVIRLESKGCQPACEDVSVSLDIFCAALCSEEASSELSSEEASSSGLLSSSGISSLSSALETLFSPKLRYLTDSAGHFSGCYSWAECISACRI